MKKKLLLMLTLCLLAQWSVAQAPKWVDKAKRAVFSVVTYDQNDKILNTGNGFFVTDAEDEVDENTENVDYAVLSADEMENVSEIDMLEEKPAARHNSYGTV